MEPLFLTKSSTFLIGPIATVMGYLMDAIFKFLSNITGGHPNTGVAIFIMTVIIYSLMTPLTIRQQKFSKLQKKMMPEIKKIQAKYKNRKDPDAVQRMNAETKEVYAKYGVSPTGSCVQMGVQLPILFALYRVIYNIPAYVGQVHGAFTGLVDGLINKVGIADASAIMSEMSSYSMFKKQFVNPNFAENVEHYAENTFIDVLNRANTGDWEALKNNVHIVSNQLSDTVTATQQSLEGFNRFLGLNIGDSPLYSIRNSGGSVLVILVAVMIPVLAAVTQFMTLKMMPAADGVTGDPTADSMASSMKTMNTTMPIVSAVMCFTLPAGLGIYWISGSLIRTIQQIFINRHIDRIDFDAVIAKNEAKAKERIKKEVKKSNGTEGVSSKKFKEYSSMNTRTISSRAGMGKNLSAEADQTLGRNKGKNYKEGSLSSKANMVSKYNHTDNK